MFKKDIIENKLNPEQVVKKYLINGSCYYFEEIYKKPNIEKRLKELLAEAFSVNTSDIFIVGSGKVGFSLKPKNLFNSFDYKYSLTKLNKDKSDLDIVIISKKLYDSIGESLYNYTAAYNEKWKNNEFYTLEKAKQFPVPLCYKCFEYYTKGWFRPDYKPFGFDFCNKGSFENLKRDIASLTNRKGTIAIFQNWFYFSNYHITNIKNLSLKVKITKL